MGRIVLGNLWNSAGVSMVSMARCLGISASRSGQGVAKRDFLMRASSLTTEGKVEIRETNDA
jgi:hypothetical protein